MEVMRQMELTSFKCPWCEYTNTNLEYSLRLHCNKIHGKSAKELYDTLNGGPKLCSCGCGKETRFYGLGTGYMTYVRGHASRVNNNWGHNEQALLKSQDKRREQIATGEWQAWNKGQTVETDERVASYGKLGSETILASEEEIAKRSQRMHDNRLSGVVPSLHGADHPRWKGGVSHLSTYCHSSSKLFNEWKRPKLKASSWKCSRCGKTDHLCVHHDKEHMADIIKRFSTAFGYEGRDDQQGMKESIAEAVASYHVDSDVSGVVLCDVCHKEEHPSLNFDQAAE